MIKTFKRKANNYRSFKLFVIITTPLSFLLTLLPIYVFLTEDIESGSDIFYLVAAFLLLLFLSIFSVIMGKKQLKAKKSYMEMTQPVLTLSEDGLTYIVDAREQFSIPWSQVIQIQKNTVIEKYKDKAGYITISCTKEQEEHIQSIKHNAFINDGNRDLLIAITYFEETLDEVYRSIKEYYEESGGLRI